MLHTLVQCITCHVGYIGNTARCMLHSGSLLLRQLVWHLLCLLDGAGAGGKAKGIALGEVLPGSCLEAWIPELWPMADVGLLTGCTSDMLGCGPAER